MLLADHVNVICRIRMAALQKRQTCYGLTSLCFYHAILFYERAETDEAGVMYRIVLQDCKPAVVWQ